MVREMQASDYEAVMALWQTTESMALKEADSQANITRYLARNPGLSFVAKQQGQIVGAVLVGTDGRRGYLQHLAVAQSMRGQGIGKQLIEHAVASLAQQGVAKTHLFVANENRLAQGFYQRLGWFARDEVRMFSFNSSTEQNI